MQVSINVTTFVQLPTSSLMYRTQMQLLFKFKYFICLIKYHSEELKIYDRFLHFSFSYLILRDLNANMKELTVSFKVSIVSSSDFVLTCKRCFGDCIRRKIWGPDNLSMCTRKPTPVKYMIRNT